MEDLKENYVVIGMAIPSVIHSLSAGVIHNLSPGVSHGASAGAIEEEKTWQKASTRSRHLA